jgi:hypothetical protein
MFTSDLFCALKKNRKLRELTWMIDGNEERTQPSIPWARFDPASLALGLNYAATKIELKRLFLKVVQQKVTQYNEPADALIYAKSILSLLNMTSCTEPIIFLRSLIMIRVVFNSNISVLNKTRGESTAFFFLGLEWNWVQLVRRPLTGVLYQARMIDDDRWWVWSSQWNENWQEIP